jgi:spermidine/putrescine transport system substrate-binding protein
VKELDIERFIADLQADGLTRRRLLRRVGAGGLGLGFAGFLAACGGGKGLSAGSGKEDTTPIPAGQISKTVTFSNWPLYIDVKGKSHPTLDKFDQKYGTHVRYIEEINDNVEFFGKVRQQYAQGNSGGRDLHVVTDWLAARMKRLGYVQKLDKSAMPNVEKNIDPAIASPDFDPKREYSVPWQTGQVLLIYRKDKVGGDLTHVSDLFDPKFKGKVTMLTEMRDTVGSVLLMDGVDPEKASLDQVMQAIDKIKKASDDGQIRRFTGNEYTRDILRGDSIAILGWSGDAFQLVSDNPNIKYKQPDEGFMVFTDSMQVPVGAPHAYTAEKLIDFFYQPEIAAEVTASVHYVPPVPAAKKILENSNPKIAQNPLVFPDLSKAHNFKTFTPDEEAQIDAAFQRAIGA